MEGEGRGRGSCYRRNWSFNGFASSVRMGGGRGEGGWIRVEGRKDRGETGLGLRTCDYIRGMVFDIWIIGYSCFGRRVVSIRENSRGCCWFNGILR